MVDVTGIDWNWLASTLWWLVPVAIFILISIVTYNTTWETLGDVTLLFAWLWFCLGLLLSMVLYPYVGVFNEEEKMVTAQLEEQGYENVTLDWDDSFTASKEGKFFKGVFYYEGDNKYRVIEVTE